MRPTSLIAAALLVLGLLGGLVPGAHADTPTDVPGEQGDEATSETAGEAPAATARTYAVVAHRGATGRGRTENGLRALRRAATLGADQVELDVRPTSDGRLVVMHDPSLNRTTNCSGRVHARSLTSIQRHCRLNDGSAVPSLESYVAAAKALDVGLFIELKRAPGWKRATWRYLRDTLTTLEYADRVRILSFSPALLHRAGKTMRTVPTLWIAHGFLPRFRQIVKVADGVSLDARFLTPRLVRRLQAKGIFVLGQVSNRRADWHRYLRVGADGASTDRTAGLIKWERKQRPSR